MAKKITPNFLKLSVALYLLFSVQSIFSQNVDITITTNWTQWARENKIELYAPGGTTPIYTVTHPDGYLFGSNTGNQSDNFSDTVPTPALNLPPNDNTPANTGYRVIIYDGYGDGWNNDGTATINVNGTSILNLDTNSFDNTPNNETEITKEIYFAVSTPDDSSFSYANSAYCPTDTDPTPTITGEAGGSFTVTPSGLSINSSTGEIDLSASTIGSYTITYTTQNPGQTSSTFNLNVGDNASFNYTETSVSQDGADVSPNLSGQSGSFSATPVGLSINSATGVIDVSESEVATYTVSYTTSGPCPVTITDTIEITRAPFPGTPIYNNANNDFPNNQTNEYIQYIPGNMPVIISAPHGGKKNPSNISNRNCGTNEEDNNTDILIKEIQKLCYEQYGLYPYIIVNDLRRSKLDPNRIKSVATCNAGTGEYFDAFHYFIDQASAEIETNYGKGLFIDLHGQSHSTPRVEAGYNLQSSAYDSNLNTTTNLGKVTIKNLIENNIQNLDFDNMVRGTQSFGGLLQTTGGAEYAAAGHAGCGRTVGYRTVPSHISSGSSQGSCDDTNPGNNAYFAGDFYNNIRHGSGDPNVSNNLQGGGTINGGGGTIDGIMTEVNRRVRDLGNAYAGAPYNRTDSRTATLPGFARDYATVIKEYIDLHYDDFSKFLYANSTYDVSGSDPTPVITGIPGGTFTSSNAGLVINSSTGVLDLSASTAGTYTVIYLAPNIHSYYKKTFSVTITGSTQDDASFSYANSTYCKNNTNPTPTITGEQGGTFSSTAGLNFVSTSTGEINLASSTAGTYTITYTTQNPGQNSSTFDVAISSNDVATFSYTTDTECVSGTDLSPTTSGQSGTFASTNGLSINSSTGVIDVSASTAGTYTVTYTTNGSCPVQITDEVTINPNDTASFSYDQSSYNLGDSDPTPTITGLSGGAFSGSSAGLVISSTTGTINLTDSSSGSYTITYTVNGSCNQVVTTQNITINGSTLDVDDEEIIKFNLFPNPTNDLLTIQSNQTITKVVINNTLGQRVRITKLDSNKQISLSGLQVGTYFITFYNEYKILGTKPVIKK